jgi:flavin-dependent dehydrogenase
VLQRLGLLEHLLARGAVWMDRFRMTDLRGRAIAAPLPDLGSAGRRALGVSRALLDTTLLRAAEIEGSDVRERVQAIEPRYDGSRVIGVRARSAGSARGHEVRANVVIAADGRRSCLVRALHPHVGDPRKAGPRSWYGLECHLGGIDPRLQGAVELHLFSGGYLGLSLVESGRINLALVVMKRTLADHGGSPDRLLRERLSANPSVAETLCGRERVDGDWKSVGPLRFGTRAPTAAGALFVGDAAGTVDPLSGEGMSNALAAAELAAPIAARAAERGTLSEDDASAYARAWRTAFGGMSRRNRRLGRLLENRHVSRIGLAVLSRLPESVVRGLVRATRTGTRTERRP